jgi:hypothetical protein
MANEQAIANPPAGSSVRERFGARNDFHAELERALIVTYLRARGHTLRSVRSLPRAEREALLRAANSYAALRLTEIEARTRLLDAMHGRC